MLDADLAETAVRCLSGLGVASSSPGARSPAFKGRRAPLCCTARVSDGTALSIEATDVILAIGQQQCEGGLEPEAADVATDDRGLVVVDEYLRTTNPRY